MMDILLPLAAKSLLIAGATLLLLKLWRRRSAADRSLIAHLGLAAVAILPLALLLPQLEVQTSWMGAEPATMPAAPATPVADQEAATAPATFPQGETAAASNPVDWVFWGYALPAGLLLLFTVIALLRLVLLKAKANVLVEPHWLTALAHAQRRMGFKHGTALLTSDELKSPISWGLMRPVILLNSEAAEAHREAEAIIAHELAHVARLDWIKLLLSRITVAMFWFNPLVWLLAREAHQLREEAADDAVLGADIEDTEYARLLVGIARHECRGLLIGAHGVAPARNSLARRVQRVLDAASARAPGGWRWTSAAGIFAAGMAVPVAALQFVPVAQPVTAVPALASNTPVVRSGSGAAGPLTATSATPAGDAAAAAAAATAVAVRVSDKPLPQDLDSKVDDLDLDLDDAIDRAVDNALANVPKFGKPGNLSPRVGKLAATPGNPVDHAIRNKTIGLTPEYINGIRASSPRLARVDDDDLVGLKIHGVTPGFVRDMAAAGYPSLRADQLTAAAIHGVSPSYARRMAAASGLRISFEDLVAMRIHGLEPAEVIEFRRAGFNNLSSRDLINMAIHGVDPEDLKSARSP